MKAAPRPRRIEGSQAAERGRYSTATTHSAATKSRLAAFTADYTATAESTTTRQTATRLRRATNMVGADRDTAALQTLRGRPPSKRRRAATATNRAQQVSQNKTTTGVKWVAHNTKSKGKHTMGSSPNNAKKTQLASDAFIKREQMGNKVDNKP